MKNLILLIKGIGGIIFIISLSLFQSIYMIFKKIFRV